MKHYVVMTSLCLVAGVAVGYWTGQGVAKTEFANGCTGDAMVVIYDYQNKGQRHFHCFELQQEKPPERRKESSFQRFAAK